MVPFTYILVLIVLVCCVGLFIGRRVAAADPTGTVMVGAIGEAIENVSSTGRVLVRGEVWSASCTHGVILKGEAVRVAQMRDGLVLVVEKASSDQNK